MLAGFAHTDSDMDTSVGAYISLLCSAHQAGVTDAAPAAADAAQPGPAKSEGADAVAQNGSKPDAAGKEDKVQPTACLQELLGSRALCCCLPWCSSYTSQPHPGLLSCLQHASWSRFTSGGSVDICCNLQVADSAAADSPSEKEQDIDVDKDKEKERHREKQRESEKEQEQEKPKRVYKTDEGLLVACRYFDRTGVAVRLLQITWLLL